MLPSSLKRSTGPCPGVARPLAGEEGASCSISLGRHAARMPALSAHGFNQQTTSRCGHPAHSACRTRAARAPALGRRKAAPAVWTGAASAALAKNSVARRPATRDRRSWEVIARSSNPPAASHARLQAPASRGVVEQAEDQNKQTRVTRSTARPISHPERARRRELPLQP